MSENVIELLTTPEGAEAAHVDVLRQRLAETASAHGLIDVAYRTIETPVGNLLLAATDLGVVRVAYAVEGHEAVLDSLSSSIGSRVLQERKRFDGLCAQLDGYFAGRRRVFEVTLDLRFTRGFRHEVLTALRSIPFGTTESYAAVAAATGRPAAVRAVGTACATNPVPVLVPCHRVVRSDGGVGGYLGGPAAKRWLLDLERDTAGATPRNGTHG